MNLACIRARAVGACLTSLLKEGCSRVLTLDTDMPDCLVLPVRFSEDNAIVREELYPREPPVAWIDCAPNRDDLLGQQFPMNLARVNRHRLGLRVQGAAADGKRNHQSMLA